MASTGKMGALVRYATFKQKDPSIGYVVLAFWIVVIILVYPYLTDSTLGRLLFSLLVSFVLISAVFSITRRNKAAMLALVLIIPALLLEWSNYIIDSEAVLITGKFLGLAVMGVVTLSIFLEVVRSKAPIPQHVIWGAVAVYLLLGLTFASLFQLVEIITPGSFMYGPDPGAVLRFSDFVYFSFVTLATLGYGDILPITGQARSFAILEAITGALYLAILIAKLVSMSIATKSEKGEG